MNGLFSQWIRNQIETWRIREGHSDRGKVDRFAKALGVAPSTVSQWLRAAATPDEYRCMALAKITGVPLDKIRMMARRIDRLAETPGVYTVDDSDVVAQIRSALGPDYALLIALPTDERQQIILSVAAILHHQLALRQRIRELPYLPTA